MNNANTFTERQIPGFPGYTATEAKVLEIEQRFRTGESRRALAKEYGISYRHVYNIGHHANWHHLWSDTK